MASGPSVLLCGEKNLNQTKPTQPIKGQYAGEKRLNKDSKASGIHFSLQNCCAVLECRASFLLPTKKKDTGATLCGSWTLDHQAAHPEQHRSPLALVSCQYMLCKYFRYCKTSKIALGVHSQAMESYSRCDILVIYWSLSLWDYSGCFHYPQISICLNISYSCVSLFPSNK